VKFVQLRPFADPEVAARKIVELANAVEPDQDGCIHIERLNSPMLFELKETPAARGEAHCPSSSDFDQRSESSVTSGERGNQAGYSIDWWLQ
jgi:hypothetical protein